MPKDLYDEMIEAFGSREMAVDALSLYMDRYARRNSKESSEGYEPMEFYVYERFRARLDNTVASQGRTLQDLMIKLIKKLCQKKKMRSDILELAQINRLKEDLH